MSDRDLKFLFVLREYSHHKVYQIWVRLKYRQNLEKKIFCSSANNRHWWYLFYMSHIAGLWWAIGPTLPWYRLNFTQTYRVMMSHWFFWFLFELNTLNWNPFQRWFSEVVWHVKTRCVVFDCSLPHLTMDQI